MKIRSTVTLAVAACVAVTALPLRAQTPAAAPAGPIEEVVVTGTYIRRQSQFDSPSPLVTVSSEDLAALGVNDIGDVVTRLTINTGSQNNPDAFTQNFTTGTSNVNLRGLGVGSTLVLINGHRQTQSAIATNRGENFVDTSSLPPMIAYDRIELLKDGATALYGSEAVAGVVNFITRSDFEGFDLQLDLQATSGYPQNDREVSALYGVGSGRTHFLVAASYLDRTRLTTYDRRLSSATDDLSQAGNPGSFLVPSLPGNPAYQSVWTAAFDSNLNGVADFVEPQIGLPAVPNAQPPVFLDPECTALAAEDPKIVPDIKVPLNQTGGIPIGLCQFDFGGFYDIVPEEQRGSAYFELTHEVSDRMRARLELSIANNDARRDNSPSFPFAAFPTVAATHPDNPYGTDVNFIGRIIGAGGTSVQSIHNSDTWRLAGTLESDINDTWGWSATAQFSENDFYVSAPDVLVDRFDLAIQGLGGPSCDAGTGTPGVGDCLYFNPFASALTGEGTVNSPALLAYLVGPLSFDANSKLSSLETVFTGELGELPGGNVGIALGAQYRSEELSYDYNDQANADNFLFLIGNPDFGDTRRVSALFTEFALPVSATVDLQLAARYEDYGQGVSSTDPKFTLLWRPSLQVSVRGSIGTSFRAPSLYQSFGTQTTLAELIDPNVGTPQFFPVRTKPNPSGVPLQPEQAHVTNFGVSWSPTDNVELGIDYWSFAYDDVIIQQNPQAILNAAANGDTNAAMQVIRDAGSGLLLQVDTYYANASSLDTDGVDLSWKYDFGGERNFTVGAEATYVSSYDLVDPQAGDIAGVGRRNFSNFGTSVPQWRANTYFNWRSDRHAINVYLRYIDSYEDDEVALGQGPEAYKKIDSFLTTDAQYNYRFRGDGGPTLAFGAINLFDERPPHVATNGGYDSKVHDPRGRLLYAKASFSF